MLQLSLIAFVLLSAITVHGNPLPATASSETVPEGSPTVMNVAGWGRPDTAPFSVSSLSFIDLAAATPSAVKVGPSLTYMEAVTKPTSDTKQKLTSECFRQPFGALRLT